MQTVEEILQFIREQSGGHQQPDGYSNPYGGQAPAKGIFVGSPAGPIYETLKDHWVRNGDQLSLQYTGTESNISRVTKQGGQGIIGKLEQWSIGVTRYYQSVMNDEFKNQCI